eukprot:scaffold50814_cov41-Attheya_sp.AAC.4
MSGKGSSPVLKQGSLFSFFTKKTASAPSNKKAASSDVIGGKKSSAPEPKLSSRDTEALLAKIDIGTQLEVHWPDDNEYYGAVVTGKTSGKSSVFTLTYDDEEVETIDLRGELFRIVETQKSPTKPTGKRDRLEAVRQSVKESPKVAAGANKKRRILEESEEEFEFEEGDLSGEDSEGSVYADGSQDENEDDDDEGLMVTDEEDDDAIVSSTKEKKHVTKQKSRVKVTPVANPYSKNAKGNNSSVAFTPPDMPPARSASFLTPVRSTSTTKAPSSSNNNMFSCFAPPKDIDSQESTASTITPNHGTTPRKITPSPYPVSLSPVTPMVILPSKSSQTGKFYEMFQMDADVGVSVLGFSYMKGHVAHAGFPEVGYANFSDKLVRAGYKVARVEQTETPDMMKKRGAKSRGPKPKVVNREVCSILTVGTRTFCYLDNDSALAEEANGRRSTGTVGPLLAIREVISQPTSESESNNISVCEYGITIIDAVRAEVTIGQFADDVLRSRMDTLLATFQPSEILVEGGENGASGTLLSLIKAFQTTSVSTRVERVNPTESFPKSTAIDASIRKRLDRRSPAHPWDAEETLGELHARRYFPRSSRVAAEGNTSRWPKVLSAAVEGGANLILSSVGAALFYLQRSLIDEEILSMGIVKAYVPPAGSGSDAQTGTNAENMMKNMAEELACERDSISLPGPDSNDTVSSRPCLEFVSNEQDVADEAQINHMSLDGTTLHNLEILSNAQTHTPAGSLWSKINNAKSPHGSRLLRAWLLRPLFQKADIDRRADAVEELVSGAAAVSMSEARPVLAKCGDIERLLSRVHSMGGKYGETVTGGDPGHHPNERAVLYETVTHTKKKVADFTKLLQGLRSATQIPELFAGVEIRSGLLNKVVKLIDDGGSFPSMEEELDWFFQNFDCKAAEKGLFEPSAGMDDAYDEACDAIARIENELDAYKNEMCSQVLQPASLARSKWTYVNTKPAQKDKYLIELPVNVQVPEEFYVKGKRGAGAKQVNKYRTPVVEQLVGELEHALDVKSAGKARGMQLVFAKFDSKRALWAAAAQATAILDAIGALAETSSKAGYTRPNILECPPNGKPGIQILQGRHPCVDVTHSGNDFIPNDLSLGGGESQGNGTTSTDTSRVLLLSGPNMGGKSTLLRQTCLISILAQIGCFVPVEECAVTPIDRIYTRLGASDRILLGQSTFFVELAETAAALRGATRRSLVIMDELGRGTSTFDGTAIASATVKHLVERNQCLALFATHYHSLLEDWKEEPTVRLGHMECIVEGGDDETNDEESSEEHNITFLYTLGSGACPRSFGINVARLAEIPAEVLSKAKAFSANFEANMNFGGTQVKVTASKAVLLKKRIEDALTAGNDEEVERIWKELQS